jgi:hypothetical protein
VPDAPAPRAQVWPQVRRVGPRGRGVCVRLLVVALCAIVMQVTRTHTRQRQAPACGCRCGEWGRVAEVYARVCEDAGRGGPAPDAATYNTVISAAARAGETAGDAREAAMDVFHDMLEARVAPDQVRTVAHVVCMRQMR